MRDLSFGFKNGDIILDQVNLNIEHGERVAIMGGSGSGKTTLLKLMAGLRSYRPRSGECHRSGRFALVFQQPLLLDHMTVISNIKLPALIQGIEQPIHDIIRILALDGLLDRYPYQLSGGQQRRVALARALTTPNTEGLLMDEAFSGLDEPLRERILVEFETGLNVTSLTIVMATHSPFEATFFADRILFIGGSPASVSGEYVVKLPSCRRSSMLDSPEFHAEVIAVRKHMLRHVGEVASEAECAKSA